MELSFGKKCLVTAAFSWDPPYAHWCLILDQGPHIRMEEVLLIQSLTGFSEGGFLKPRQGFPHLRTSQMKLSFLDLHWEKGERT